MKYPSEHDDAGYEFTLIKVNKNWIAGLCQGIGWTLMFAGESNTAVVCAGVFIFIGSALTFLRT